jgi:hypothetical protein
MTTTLQSSGSLIEHKRRSFDFDADSNGASREGDAAQFVPHRPSTESLAAAVRTATTHAKRPMA